MYRKKSVAQNLLQHNWDFFVTTFRLNPKFYGGVNDGYAHEAVVRDGCVHDGYAHTFRDVNDGCEVTATCFEVKC